MFPDGGMCTTIPWAGCYCWVFLLQGSPGCYGMQRETHQGAEEGHGVPTEWRNWRRVKVSRGQVLWELLLEFPVATQRLDGEMTYDLYGWEWSHLFCVRKTDCTCVCTRVCCVFTAEGFLRCNISPFVIIEATLGPLLHVRKMETDLQRDVTCVRCVGNKKVKQWQYGAAKVALLRPVCRLNGVLIM